MRFIAALCATWAACIFAASADDWKPLFDGKTLEGWTPTKFAGAGEVEVREGAIVMQQGVLTGVNYTNAPPNGTYQVELEARRTLGQDFFCGLTFPVRDSFATLVVGGWGGGVVGISSLDGEDAAHNETTSYHRFKSNQWYRIRLSVAPDRIKAWIDGEQVVDADIHDKRVSLREGDIELSKPFGIASWSTTAELRNIRLSTPAPPSGPKARQGRAGEIEPEPAAETPPALAEKASKLMRAALDDQKVWPRLALLCDTFGPRITGGTNLEAAADWILAEMKQDGLENVHGETATTPHWIRGEERAELVAPRAEPLALLALGGTAGTGPGGITAPVLVVTNFNDLTNHGAEASGRIVLFNVPFKTYGDTVAYRWGGPTAAASFGAKAALVRSVTPKSLKSPHTGQTDVSDPQHLIPAAALAVEDAERLARWQARGVTPVVHLVLGARTEEPTQTRNLIGELRGTESPDEVVVVGGHIDSWDVGQGAQDDGGNCVAAWEAVKLLHDLDIRPRRTVRVVLWTGEENSGAGGKAYALAHKDELPKTVAAIESDSGVFAPAGLDVSAKSEAFPILRSIASLMGKALDAGSLSQPEGEADLGALRAAGVPCLGLKLKPNHYFWYHHTQADTVDAVDPADLKKVTAALAGAIYALADWPTALPR
jgi:carboxypeptidase Q